MVFVKIYSSFCKSTRSLLKTMKATINFEVSVLDLDLMKEEDGPIFQMEMLKRTGQPTVPVPSVFIGSKHVRGNSDLQHLVSESAGKRQKMLADVVALRSSVVRANHLRLTIAGNKPSGNSGGRGCTHGCRV